MIKKISTKVFLTTIIATSFLLLQGCKEMSSLTSDGIKKATTAAADKTTTTDITPTAEVQLHVLTMTAPTVVEVNQCVPLIISLKNSKNENVAASENLSVVVTGAPGTLYSNNTCSTVQSSTVVFPKNALSKTIYVIPTVNQSYVIDLEETAMKATPSNFILSVTNPQGATDALKLAVTGPASLQAGQCRSYVVSLQNTLGTNKNASALLALSLSGQGSGSFHSGTNCAGGAISTLNLPMGSSFVSFSYQNSNAENVNFVVDSPLGSSIQSAFYSTQVTALSAAVPTQLVLTGPTSVTAGACSGPVVVKTVDASFNSTAVASNLSYTISGGAGFSVFTNASCATSLVSPVINASTSSSSFYFIASAPGNIVISADDSGPLTDAAISVQATASSGTSAVKFTLTGPASVLAGACSAGYTVKTTNGSGIESPVNATTVVNITGKGSGDFYTDAGCTSMISSVTFAAGDSSKSFYYKGASVANLTFNVDDVGPLTPASTSVSIVPDSPTQLNVTGPSPIILGECRAYTVTAKDANNFVSVVSGTTSINLTGAGAGSFYSDSSCINSTSSIVVNSGQSSALFYYKATSAASVTLSADNSGSLTTGTRTVVVDPLPYSKVVFTRPTLNAGSCTAVTITLKDSLNNTALASSSVGVTLTANGGAAFYSANTCLAGVLITSANITTGTSSVVVYLKDNVAGAITLGAASTGLSSDSWNATVNPGPNSALKLVGPATNSVGACTAYDLRLEDSLGNLSPAASSTSVNFTGLSNARFYSDVNCTALASSTTLLSGTSQAQVYLKGSTAEALTVVASSGSLTQASVPVSLIAGSSNKLIISGASTASAGACTALSVAVQDSYNNPINQGSNLVVTMLGNSVGSFYSENTCTTLASTVTVPSGSSSALIYFKSNAPASLGFTAQGSSLFDGTKSLTINPLAPTKLVMTGSTSILSGVCTAYSISLQDTLNNLSATGSAKTLNFSGAMSGAFYSDSSCALPAASISLTSTQTTASIYYKASAAQTPNLVVDDSGLPDLTASTLPITVTSSGGGVSIALKISGATSANTNTCVPYAVMTTDASGLSHNVTSNMTATLAGAGTGAFYSDSACTTTSSTVVINSGTSLSYIYYMSATAQNLVFSGTASGASATTLPVAIVSSAGPSTVSRITLAGSSSILTNACIPYVVSLADSNGNSMNAASNTTITLSGKENGDFYTENTCTTSAAGSIVINSGTSYKTVYFKDPTPQNLILIAQSAGLSNGTFPVSITATAGGSNAGPAVKLAFVAQPSAVASTSENFAEQPIVAVQDSNNNVASSSAATITLSAYTDSACSMSAGSIVQATTNPANASGGVVNFAGVNITSSQTIYIKATSPGLAPACSTAIQVYPSVPAKLAFTLQPSTSAVAGVNLTVQPNVSVLNYTNQVVTNAINGVSIAAFTDSSCSTPATGTFTLAVNNVIPTNGVVSFSGISYNVASTIYLKATASGLTSACSSGVTVGPAAPASIGVYYQPAAAGKAGDTFSITGRLYDAFGNASLSNHNLALTAYKTSNCTGATSSITGGSATAVLGTATFSSVVFSESSTMSLKISDVTNPSVTSVCSNPISVDGGAPAKLVFSTQPSSTSQVYVSLATSPAVMVQDSFSNQVRSATNPITIAAFTNNTCTTPATGTLTATNLTVTPSGGVASFASITYSTMEVIYLKATASGLTSACSSAITLTSLSTKISTKNNTSCAVVSGNVKCWGYNNSSQLGDASTASAPYPAYVAGTTGTGSLSNITDVVVGGGTACALSNTGNVYCWGANSSGRLGDNSVGTGSYPVQVRDTSGSGYLSGIISISGGGSHTCALSSAGLVYCWGLNSTGQLGDNTATTRAIPVQVSSLTGVSSISAGITHTCATTSSGAGYCWGANSDGRLGDASSTQRNTPVLVKDVGGSNNLTNLIAISAGDTHSCAVKSTGETYCWGLGTTGQLGDNTIVSKTSPVQVSGLSGVGTLSGIISVSVGTNHTCAVKATREVFCWGIGTSGQLGEGNTTSKSFPTQVQTIGGGSALTNIISISSGNNSSCALSDDGNMFCWGVNTYWQLGDQTQTTRTTPVKVKENSSTFSSISANGLDHSCGISNEKVYCWGGNSYGQLGDGTTTTRNTPTLVPSINGVKQVSTGYYTTCAVLNSGSLYCWGNNGNSQIGDGTATSRSVPTLVNLSNVIEVSTSGTHTCAIITGGAAYCWGLNNYNQLGEGTTSNRPTPYPVSGGLNFSSISAAYSPSYSSASHTCGLTTSGAAYCWGYNGHYQIGDATSTQAPTPTLVYGASSGVTAISTKADIGCIIQSGAGKCWSYAMGSNMGTYPTTIWASGVTAISAGAYEACAIVNQAVTCYGPSNSNTNGVSNGSALRDIKAISSASTSNSRICALKNNGSLYCWGYDANTTLNFGTSNSTTTPTVVAVPPSSNNSLTSVAVGESHTCGILNGITQCWGTSANGALGTGTTTSLTPSPVLIASNSSALIGQSVIGAGGSHSCSLSSIGEVYCWGDNSYGKLGINSTVHSNKAVKVLGAGGIGTMANATSLAVGYRHNCTVVSGAVYCWGYNTDGQLGIDSTMTMGTPTQVVGVGGTGNLSGVSKVVAGKAHTCALVGTNVYCWGSNQNGQLGGNTAIASSNTPIKVVSVSGVGTLSNVSNITAGANHTCALANGITYCWGANASQQLGNNTTQDASYPVGVMNSDYITLNGVTSISAGAKHSCALTSLGETYCWGSGAYGQLGLNSTSDTGAATKVVGVGGSGNLSASFIATGSTANHSCAISVDQTNLYCWGAGASGQMGNGSNSATQLFPTPFTYSAILYLMVR